MDRLSAGEEKEEADKQHDMASEEGWLEIGAALNMGRAQFPDDNNAFGEWKEGLCQLGRTHPADQAAAMWDATNPFPFPSPQPAAGRCIRLDES